MDKQSNTDTFKEPSRSLSEDELEPEMCRLPDEPTSVTAAGCDDRREAGLVLPSGPFRPETELGEPSTVEEGDGDEDPSQY
ncbi:hypothetical protein [Rhodococcus koreensis]